MNPADHQLPRRQFLWEAGAGFAGLALTGLLEGDGFFAKARAAELPRPSPLLPKAPHFPTKAKSVIFLCLAGGPSHLETFDYKPLLAKMNGEPMPESVTKGQPIAQLQGQKLVVLGPRKAFR